MTGLRLSAFSFLVFFGMFSHLARAQLAPRAALEEAESRVTFDGSVVYTFQAAGRKTITYTVDISHPEIQQGLLRIQAAVERGPFHTVLAGAGTRWRNA